MNTRHFLLLFIYFIVIFYFYAPISIGIQIIFTITIYISNNEKIRLRNSLLYLVLLSLVNLVIATTFTYYWNLNEIVINSIYKFIIILNSIYFFNKIDFDKKTFINSFLTFTCLNFFIHLKQISLGLDLVQDYGFFSQGGFFEHPYENREIFRVSSFANGYQINGFVFLTAIFLLNQRKNIQIILLPFFLFGLFTSSRSFFLLSVPLYLNFISITLLLLIGFIFASKELLSILMPENFVKFLEFRFPFLYNSSFKDFLSDDASFNENKSWYQNLLQNPKYFIFGSGISRNDYGGGSDSFITQNIYWGGITLLLSNAILIFQTIRTFISRNNFLYLGILIIHEFKGALILSNGPLNILIALLTISTYEKND